MAFAFNPRTRFSPFVIPGMESDLPTPDPVAAALAPGLGVSPSPTPEPFIWGKGGSRMTTEQVEAARQSAQGQMDDAGSYAPVQHWLQGLDRSLGAVTGGLAMKRARKADEANRAESDAVVEALLEGGDKKAVMAALVNPYVDERTRGLAEMQFKAMQPAKPSAPPEIIELAQIANDPARPVWEREAAAAAVKAKTDPFINATLPGGRFYSGPQSGLAVAMGGGGQASGAPQTTVPPAEAIAELKRDPSGAAEFDEVFGAGAAARILGGGAGNSAGGFPGG